jgi:ABC-type antimicrobial peptide transport system permease subunit
MYAAIGQAVTRRTREIGIRLAVGATSRDIVSAVTAGQLRTMAVGAGVGLVLSAGAARLLTSQIVGVQAWDPLVVMLATAVLAAAAACGHWLPVRRALRIAPAIVLRQE